MSDGVLHCHMEVCRRTRAMLQGGGAKRGAAQFWTRSGHLSLKIKWFCFIKIKRVKSLLPETREDREARVCVLTSRAACCLFQWSITPEPNATLL